MPELPEVETTLRGLAPFVLNQPFISVTTHVPKLRNVLASGLAQALTGATTLTLTRRNKYLLFGLDTHHTLLMHLGMSGRFVVHPGGSASPRHRHEHLTFTTPTAHLRYHDARRFGLALLISTSSLANHPLLAGLGPEPLSPAFSGASLFTATRGKTTPIKPLLMANTVVVGVGNIYASESLFHARLHPTIPAQALTQAQCHTLAASICLTLTAAIAAGGTTLRDFQAPDGQLGYFHSQFMVYGRAGQPCLTCGTPIASATMAQRNTFWCPRCQPLKSNKPLAKRTKIS